jgi:outer membrane receptor protein involved in Fe transport
VFTIDWDNFQLDTQSFVGGYLLAANGAKARSRGIELALDGEFESRIGYALSYTYTKATVAQDFAITDTDGAGGFAAIVTGRNGDDLPNAPKSSATLDLHYTQPAPGLEGWKVRWHVGGTYRSSTLSRLVNAAPGSPAPFVIQGFSIWGASVELMNRSGYYASLYGENLFNQLGITGGVDAGEVGLRSAHYFVGRPRTVGLRMGYRF